MTDIVNFLISLIYNVAEYCWQVSLSMFLKAKVPKLVFLRAEGFMSPAVGASSPIAHPNIVALIGKEKCWGQVFIIEDKGVRCIKETVH